MDYYLAIKKKKKKSCMFYTMDGPKEYYAK